MIHIKKKKKKKEDNIYTRRIGLYFTTSVPVRPEIYRNRRQRYAIRWLQFFLQFVPFFLFLPFIKIPRVCCWVAGATGLKDLTINVPSVVRSGDTVTLSCHYDLEGLPLYSLQWFLEGTEFYRYLPEGDPPYSAFNIDGIHVNVSVAHPLLFSSKLIRVRRPSSILDAIPLV